MQEMNFEVNSQDSDDESDNGTAQVRFQYLLFTVSCVIYGRVTFRLKSELYHFKFVLVEIQELSYRDTRTN